MTKRGKIVLRDAEIQKLRRGETLVLRLKPGMEEIELKTSICVQWEKKAPIGSVESIIDHMKFDR